MSETRRFIIVRSGDIALFEQLRRRFAGDPSTVIQVDRRSETRRTGRRSMVLERRRRERRRADDAVILAVILATRGYFVIRTRPRALGAPRPCTARGA
jgi:hypothetical protein